MTAWRCLATTALLLPLAACSLKTASVAPGTVMGAVVVYEAQDGFLWEVEDRLIAPDTYRLTVKQGKFKAGGQGEARQYFQRRAEDIAAVQGCTGYTTLEYNESLTSDILSISQRVTEGVIRCERNKAGN
jgi:hypothetical protein